MKRSKPLIALLLIVLLLIPAIIPAYATTFYYSSGYELYREGDSNGWIINSYAEDSSEINLPSVLLEDNVTTIGGRSFEKRTTLTSVTIPSSFTTIGAYAFDGCTSLSNVAFGENLQYIYVGAFRYCDLLTTIDLSGTKLSLIANTAFYKCSGLTEVTLPDTLESIGANAFANCSSLKKIIIGRNVTAIASSAFNNSPNTVIYCYYDSFTYNFAKDNNISYVLLDGVKLGDTDGDKHVSINDVTAIQQHLAELESIEGIYLYAADANRDGVLDISDATTIQMFLAEYELPYPIGEIITQ